MITTLLSHQWKAFWRGRNAGKNLAAQIFIGFILLYLLGSALTFGLFLKPFLKEIFPHQDVIQVFCSLIGYYFSFDLIIRFTFQELPILSVQPYLGQNIRKSQLVNFLNIRSLFHFLNLIPILLFTPFTVTTIATAYGWLPATCFMIGLLSITTFDNFLILFIKRKSIINSWWLVGFLGVVSTFIALDYFHLFSFRQLSANLSIRLLKTPWLVIVPVGLGLAAFINNRRFLYHNLYVEEISKGGKQKQSTEYTWLQQLGLMGELIGLDIKLILRNKRPKATILISCMFLLYGFIFYRPENLGPNRFGMLLFGAIMITGIFIINYGQFLFAWQSSHFDGLMTANISMKDYIKAKLRLFTVVSTASFIITSFYGFIDWRILPIQAAAFLFNIGINSVGAVYLATYSYKGIDLSKSATFNYQGTGMSQWIYALIIMLVPFVIYFPLSRIINPWVGIIIIGLVGLIGLLLQNWLIDRLTIEFAKRKYRVIEGFREK